MKNLVNPKPAICYADIDKIPEKYGEMLSSKEVKHRVYNRTLRIQFESYWKYSTDLVKIRRKSNE